MAVKKSGATAYRYIAVGKLQFDQKNPRLFGSHNGLVSQDKLQKTLVEKFSALELVDSILVNGFMPYEPLVVKASGNRFTVIEGNRRLSAVRYILQNRNSYKDKATVELSSLKKLPCIIFGKADIRNEQTYLGLRHFSGYREWKPRSKAEYLMQQIDSGINPSELAVRLNTTTTRLKKYITTVSLLKKERGDKEKRAGGSLGAFWMLAEALQRAPIRQYVDLQIDPKTSVVKTYDRKNFSKLYSYLYGADGPGGEYDERAEPIVSETRQISKLANILGSKKATAVLEKTGNLDRAYSVSASNKPIDEKLLSDCADSIRSFLSANPDKSQKKKLLSFIRKLLE